MEPQTTCPHIDPSPARGETTVVYGNHQFCAGRNRWVEVMAQPHRHSQFEINFLLSGSLVYWFEGMAIRIDAGVPVLFWGMVPHRVIQRASGTEFVCLYVPAALMMQCRIGEDLRGAMFRGKLIAANRPHETDAGVFRRWYEDLSTGETSLSAIVAEELSTRMRRIEHDGWTDLCAQNRHSAVSGGVAAPRPEKVEAMMRFIGENFADPIDVADVAKVAGLHPNYAMGLFKKAVGLTIANYLVRSRLYNAQALLASTDEDIAGIAYASGFQSMSRFYEAFKARFEISPARFRRWQRAEAALPSAPGSGAAPLRLDG